MRGRCVSHCAGRPAHYDSLIASLDTPMLIIHGTDDRISLPAMSRHTASLARNATLKMYGGCGHMPFWEDPNRFDRDLLDFLDTSPSASEVSRG